MDGHRLSPPLWQHVVRRFAGFLGDLTPHAATTAAIAATAADLESLLTRWLRVRAVAEPRLCAGLPLLRTLGAHAHATALAGDSTLDLLLVLGDAARPTQASRDGRPATSPALRRITELLGQRYGAVAIDRQGWISVRSDRTAAVAPIRARLLPAYRCATGGVLVVGAPRLAAPVRWRQLDVEAQQRALEHADGLSHGKARHLIRLVKAWRNAVQVPLSGFAIELLVVEFLLVWIYRRRSLLFYDWMVRDFFFWLAAQSGRSLPVPGTIEHVALGDRWRPAAEQAHRTARLAADLERQNDTPAALTHWRNIFGPAFDNKPPLPHPLFATPNRSAPRHDQ